MRWLHRLLGTAQILDELKIQTALRRDAIATALDFQKFGRWRIEQLMAAEMRPFMCPKLGCDVADSHLHVIIDTTSQLSGGTDRG
jgi:hypothetical protein